MDIATIRAATHARPFRPFYLCLGDGSAVRVSHPDFIALSPTGRTVAVETESSHLLDVNAILRLEFDPGAEIDPTVQAIRAALRATPFRSFVIRLTDGRSYTVPDPRYLFVSPGGRRVLFFRPEDDAMTVLEPPFLRALEIVASPAETQGTGS